jgi:two-component system, chemotaxis family, sensor kinase CheA
MLISKKRHESELSDAVAKATRLNEEILGGLLEAIFMLDKDNLIRAPISRSMETLFRRRDLRNMRFEQFLQSIVTEKICAASLEFLKKARTGDVIADLKAGNPLQDVAAKISNPDGGTETKYLNFSFRRIISVADPHKMIVAVSDVTQRVELTRELEELRAYSKIQATCLSSLTRVGSERFAAFLRQADGSMNLINAALKKPARETVAFRAKLDEILREVAQLKAEATLLELQDIEALAQAYEDALINLKKAEALTGTDFLPLAVRLDELFAYLAMMRNMTNGARAPRAEAATPGVATPGLATPGDLATAPSAKTLRNGSRTTDSGTEIIEPKKLAALLDQARQSMPSGGRSAPLGGLESALHAMTEHAAQSHNKSVALACEGLADVPAAYQGVVKNVAIQLIRNAVVHGIESPEERAAAGKPAVGQLTLRFERREDRSYSVSFDDDGRGLDAELLRRTAVAKGLISAEAAEHLPHRQAIKLIFKKRFTTVEEPDAEGGRGMGMALVRRYIADAGGRIGLASEQGRHTRFRVTLPAVGGELEHSQVA